MEIPVAPIVLRAVPIVQLVLKIRSKKEKRQAIRIGDTGKSNVAFKTGSPGCVPR